MLFLCADVLILRQLKAFLGSPEVRVQGPTDKTLSVFDHS